MNKSLMIAMLSLAMVYVVSCAPLQPAAADSPYREVKIEFDGSGNQTKLEITYVDAKGNSVTTEFEEGDGVPDGVGADPDNVLWGGTNVIQFIEGSNCVVIGGKKYCV